MNMLSIASGKGDPVILVPGGLTGWVSWEPHAKSLSMRRRVIRVQLLSVQLGLEGLDLPGDYSVKTESRALAATLDELEYAAPVDIVGWSYGALIALDFALDFPDRVRTLTLIEPPALWILREAHRLDADTERTMEFFASMKGDITEDQLASFLSFAGFLKPGQSARDLPQWNVWTGFRQSLRNNPAVVVHRDDLARLSRLTARTLLVKGTGSASFLHQIIEELRKALPRARLVELPSGHAPHIVSMDRFLTELEGFQLPPNSTSERSLT